MASIKGKYLDTTDIEIHLINVFTEVNNQCSFDSENYTSSNQLNIVSVICDFSHHKLKDLERLQNNLVTMNVTLKKFFIFQKLYCFVYPYI